MLKKQIHFNIYTREKNGNAHVKKKDNFEQYIKEYFLKQNDEMTNKSWSIYNKMESVFATIWIALRGSTISFSLFFPRTQSGANLKIKNRISVPTADKNT